MGAPPKMNWRNRWTFWSTAAVALALVSVPSAEWLTTMAEYRRFLAAWEPAPLRPTSTDFTPHLHPLPDPSLTPVEFRHRAPKAGRVELVGDFNAWKPGLLRLRRDDDGTWSIVVPVPEGKRRYLFLVDGEPQLDAKAGTADGPQGRRVSERRVP